MDNDPMADDVYQPTYNDVREEDAARLDDLEDAVEEPSYDELLDEGYSPPEKPLGVTKYGTTAAEQRAGESLDQRLVQEEPDVREPEGDGVGDLPGGDGELIDPEAGEARAGRLMAPDEGAHPDTEKDEVAYDMGIDGGAASAEEAAAHVTGDDFSPPDDEPIPPDDPLLYPRPRRRHRQD
ncbi:DUF5709 domain-containing protein [Streptomyces sp. NPDC059597]|uniref:DUF5709 domain-containing protein n=1 Tax=Streptomyces sp. NPDC059597 TaxID=3346879 RepID=UPI00367A822D